MAAVLVRQGRFLEVLDVAARLSLASGAGNDLNHVAAIVQAEEAPVGHIAVAIGRHELQGVLELQNDVEGGSDSVRTVSAVWAQHNQIA
jgi:hypothetical protein